MGITENVDEFIQEMKDFRKNGFSQSLPKWIPIWPWVKIV